ncbi:MAG: hypothetical protein ABSE86_08840 [Bryobacteraceae bacterium]|jgi:ABC-type lipoprotein release transport system permease subunit
MSDIHHALCLIRLRPGFTAAAAITLALGAARTDVLRMVVRQGMMLGVIGMAIGAAAALMILVAASQLLACAARYEG